MRIFSTIYKEYMTQLKKKQIIQLKKMGKRSEYIFFQRRYTSGHCIHEKVLNTTSHQGNATRTPVRYNFNLLGWLELKKKLDNNK